MANHLAATTRSWSPGIMLDDVLTNEAEEKSYRLILTCRLPRVRFSVHEVMSVLVHENCLCYSKKFRTIIGKNFIAIHDTSLVKNHVYDQMYTRTRTVRKGVYKIRPLVKSPGKYRGSQPVNNNIL